MWQSIAQDVSYALRAFRGRPGFTAAALLTLALGIGANTAIFSVVHAVLIRDLPYATPDRIVQIYETHRQYGFDRGSLNPFNLDVWQRQAASFSRIAPTRSAQSTLTGSGDAERILTPTVSAEFFEVMGVPPAAGRVFSEAEAEGGAPVLVLSHKAWTRRFGGDPGIVGRTVTLNDREWTIVGLMPAGFDYPVGAEFWRPLFVTAKERAELGSYYLGAVGRLKPGVSLEQAQHEMNAIASDLETRYPKQRKDRGVRLAGLQADLASRVADGLELLQVVVVVVLLIACANLANLQLAQAGARLRELAVRAAVGAHRSRLVRQLLTESVLLAIIGGALGSMLAVVGVPALLAAAPPLLQPTFTEVGVSMPVLAFTLALSMLCGIIFGVVPALLFSRPNVVETLRQDSQGSAGSTGSQRWFRSALIASEVALAVVLLFGSALLVRSYVRLSSQDTGLNTERLLTATVTLPARYATPDARRTFWQSLLERLAASPDIESAAASTALPFSNWEWQTDFQLESRPDLKHDGSGIRTVTANVFSTIGVSVTAGRTFSATDTLGAESVAVVNDVFAQQFLGGANPIGERLRFDPRSPEWHTIVGVVSSTRHRQLSVDPGPEIYRPLSQSSDPAMILALRTRPEPEAVIGTLRAAVREIDPAVPVQSPKSMKALVAATTATQRFHTQLLTLFALLASSLTVVGIYGVTAYVVGLRTREMGIRLALGATPAAVRNLVVGQGVRPVIAGLAVGLGLSLYAAQLIESQLFGITARDMTTLVGTGITFLLVGLLACLAPARRCSRVNPLTALRM